MSSLLHNIATRGMRQTLRQVYTTASVGSFKRNRGTGDQGQSSLYSLERRWKDDQVFEALGATDELSSVIGLCNQKLRKHGLFDVEEMLIKVQCCLQDVGSHIATPANKASKSRIERTRLDEDFSREIDQWIDQYAEDLPELKNFILPGGGESSALLHVARSQCRRTERRVASLVREKEAEESALVYLNRLSDLLFVLSRYVCQKTGENELSYRKPTSFTPLAQWDCYKM